MIKHRDAMWREELKEQTKRRGGDDPIAQLRSVFDVLRELFASDTFAGCLFISAAMEFLSAFDPIHQAAKANFDAIREIIVEIATDCGFRTPESFAAKFKIIMEGAIIAELVDRNHEAANQAAELANILIERCIEDETDGSPLNCSQPNGSSGDRLDEPFILPKQQGAS